MGFAKYYKSVVYLLNAAYFTKVINMPVHLKRLIVKNSGSQMGEKHPKQKQRFNHATLFLLFGNLQNYTIEQVYQYPISKHVPLVIQGNLEFQRFTAMEKKKMRTFIYVSL